MSIPNPSVPRSSPKGERNGGTSLRVVPQERQERSRNEDSDDWKWRAACAGQWQTYDDETAEGQAAAKRICRTCPVIRHCFDYALDNDLRHHVLAGLTPAEREPLRKARQAQLQNVGRLSPAPLVGPVTP